MLVGLHPYRNLDASQMASPRLRGAPDVGLLPGPDRAVVLQALSPEPDRRFRSCREFVLALEEATMAAVQGTVIAPSQSLGGVATRLAAPIEPAATANAAWKPAYEELVTSAGRGHEVRTAGPVHYRIAHADHVEYRSWARLPAGMTRLKMDGFREQWQADEVCGDERRYVFQIQARSSLWDRCLGRAPGVQIEIRIGTADAAGLTPIRVHAMPVDCNRSRGEHLLAELAPTVLGSLQSYLHSQSDRASQERFPLHQKVCLQAPGSGKAYVGQLRDIGKDGLCVVCDEPVSAGTTTVTLCRWASPLTVQVPARVVDCLPDEKQFEVELRLG